MKIPNKKKLLKDIEFIEKLVIRMISLIGWIHILIEVLKIK
jgi:hypothetical protein